MKIGNKGFSLIELLIVVAIILIIAAIALPNFLHARISANEASAVSSLRTITTAQISYKISHDTYAPDMDALGPAGAQLLTGAIGVAPYKHSGYQFSSSGNATAFQAGAVPISLGSSGNRSFCTDTPAALYYSATGSGCDPASSPVLGQ